MTGMVETCARAMKPDLFEGGPDETRGPVTRHEREVARSMVRAVLEALREPTPEMLWAHELPHIGPDEIRECWQAMIDAALSPQV